VAQSLGESMALAAQTKLSRDGFDRFVAYLHGTCVLHGMLNVSVRAEELPDDVDGDELLGSAPAEWGLSGVSFEQIAASDYTAESATHIVHSVVLAAVRSLVSGVIESTQPSGGAEAAAADEGEGGGESFPPPLGGLTPVLESTERSAFSSTAEWGGKGGSGSSELASARDDQLASVKKGFFDASQLDASIDESADLPPSAEAVPEAELRARYERTRADYERTKKECEELKAKLANVRTAETEQQERHNKNVKKMLKANESLQQQLKDLNGVVERVVQTSLGLPAGKAPRLPAAAFPAQAKPGSKAQRAVSQAQLTTPAAPPARVKPQATAPALLGAK